MIEFIKAGMMTSIQDKGRIGLAYYGIPQSGAMDHKALRTANVLAGNRSSSACFEFTVQGGHIKFHTETKIGLTGADMEWKINGEEVGRYQSIHVQKGDVLNGGYAQSGVRAYLAIQGQIDAPYHYDSFSTYTYGDTGHAMIKTGDRFEITRDTALNTDIISMVIFFEHDAETIEFLKGPEWDVLDDSSKSVIHNKPFKISSQSNRMGARLEGNTLAWKKGVETNTAPLVPGMIQLPPNGNPIVILQDGQTTGGYPRIAYIRQEELWKFNQIRFGRELRLKLAADSY